MEKITGRSDGINWVHYYNFELDDGVCKMIDSYRLHKFDDFQGADKHPRDTVNVRFSDESGCSGYGRLITHVTLEIGKGYRYPMYADMTSQADKLAAHRMLNRQRDAKREYRSVVRSVTQDVERALKFGDRSFGAGSKGAIY